MKITKNMIKAVVCCCVVAYWLAVVGRAQEFEMVELRNEEEAEVEAAAKDAALAIPGVIPEVNAAAITPPEVTLGSPPGVSPPEGGPAASAEPNAQPNGPPPELEPGADNLFPNSDDGGGSRAAKSGSDPPPPQPGGPPPPELDATGGATAASSSATGGGASTEGAGGKGPGASDAPNALTEVPKTGDVELDSRGKPYMAHNGKLVPIGHNIPYGEEQAAMEWTGGSRMNEEERARAAHNERV